MKEVELKIHDMSTTLYPADAYALVLEEVEGGRKYQSSSDIWRLRLSR